MVYIPHTLMHKGYNSITNNIPNLKKNEEIHNKIESIQKYLKEKFICIKVDFDDIVFYPNEVIFHVDFGSFIVSTRVDINMIFELKNIQIEHYVFLELRDAMISFLEKRYIRSDKDGGNNV